MTPRTTRPSERHTQPMWKAIEAMDGIEWSRRDSRHVGWHENSRNPQEGATVLGQRPRARACDAPLLRALCVGRALSVCEPPLQGVKVQMPPSDERFAKSGRRPQNAMQNAYLIETWVKMSLRTVLHTHMDEQTMPVYFRFWVELVPAP